MEGWRPVHVRIQRCWSRRRNGSSSAGVRRRDSWKRHQVRTAKASANAENKIPRPGGAGRCNTSPSISPRGRFLSGLASLGLEVPGLGIVETEKMSYQGNEPRETDITDRARCPRRVSATEMERPEGVHGCTLHTITRKPSNKF